MGEVAIILRPVHFLIYLNRSGSTLLAQKLAQFEDIAVGLECGLGKNFFQDFYVENTEQMRYWLEQAYSSNKFIGWNISRDSLYQALQRQDKPFRTDKFLKCALNEQFKDDPAKILIHKGREIFGDLEYYLQLFDDAKVIFIQRDPRAVYNSQQKSIDSSTKQPMQTDVVQFAIAYKNTKLKLKHYSKQVKFKNRLLVLNYEALFEEEEKELKRILKFLDVRNCKRNNYQGYHSRIPAEQQHLHTNVDKGNITERIYAWEKELPREDQAFLNVVLKNEIYMRDKNNLNTQYFPWEKPFQFIKRVLLFYYKTLPRHLAKKTLVKLRLRSSL